ncbi:MAG TPA: M28 family metallopeptidase [Allosphingosinicella sp.]|jgi:Zn-dependent M28 family amino/carboxypeptidase
MRLKTLFAAAAALSLPVAGFAQQTGTPAFTGDAFRSHVAFLADDLLQGRNTGEPGYEIAARYVATRFQGLGLKPAGPNGSWYQQVPFVTYKLGETPARLTIGGRTFENGKEFVTGASSSEANQTIEAPAVFVGYGIDAPAQGFNDYAGLDVKGKVVVMLGGVPEGTASDIGAHFSRGKARMAEQRGAIGIVTIRTPADQERRPWSALTGGIHHSSMTWVGPDGRPFTDAPGIRFSATLDTPAAEALFAGSKTPLAAIFAQAGKKGAKPKGFALKQPLKLERQSVSQRTTSPNVIAMLPGSDPALANEYVLLMAHLDHVGVDPKLEGDKIHNGAMDNATGISTMLEAARAFVESGQRPRRPILFAAVTAEEKGLLGSQYLAKNPVVGGGKVVGVVNLDMPVLLYDFQDVIAFGAEHSTLGPIVERAGAQMGVKLSADPLPQENLFVRSDHYRFVQEGIPSVFLMTGFANGGEQKFTGFLKTNYHKPTDDLSQPIDWQAGAKFARINYLIAREIADSPEAPRWYADSFFGKTMAPNQPKAQRAAR